MRSTMQRSTRCCATTGQTISARRPASRCSSRRHGRWASPPSRGPARRSPICSAPCARIPRQQSSSPRSPSSGRRR
ncbi:hypothetical protein IP69_19715 [Bosea sp. AAP35]|nr:hypothetical protein IP69_19715 [Bosea sp. AAP35]